MSRVKIVLPSTFLFEVELPVRIADLNYGNHVGNDSILSLMQEARALFYKQLGFSSEVKLVDSIGQVVADAAVVYKAEAFFGDVMIISLAVDNFHAYGFDMFYRITNKVTGKEIARGKTGIISFDYTTRKMVHLPEEVRNKISGR